MPHVLTPEDWISFKQVSDPQISPDGELIAFVVADTFKANGGTRSYPLRRSTRSPLQTDRPGG